MANGGSCDGTTRLYTRGGGQATSKGFSGWVGEVREKIRETRELRVKKVCLRAEQVRDERPAEAMLGS